MSALDDVVARLKKDVPDLIAAAQNAGTVTPPDDPNVVELTTLADQTEAALAALKGPGTPTPPPAPSPPAGETAPPAGGTAAQPAG